jgi:hypothetical protein
MPQMSAPSPPYTPPSGVFQPGQAPGYGPPPGYPQGYSTYPYLQKSLPKGRLQVIGIIEIVIGAFGAIISVLSFWAFMSLRSSGYFEQFMAELQASQGYTLEQIAIIESFIFPVLLIIAVFSISMIIFGIGLLQFTNWGKIGTIVICVFFLLYFPIGTIIGALIIYLLTRPEVNLLIQNAKKH